MSRNRRNLSDALLSRPDLRRIAELIEPGSRVLDLGCGSGEFLHYLSAAKQVRGLGIEIDPKKIAEDLRFLDRAVTEDLPDEELIGILRGMIPTYHAPDEINRRALDELERAAEPAGEPAPA